MDPSIGYRVQDGKWMDTGKTKNGGVGQTLWGEYESQRCSHTKEQMGKGSGPKNKIKKEKEKTASGLDMVTHTQIFLNSFHVMCRVRLSDCPFPCKSRVISVVSAILPARST
jgi:hypothetical protein